MNIGLSDWRRTYEAIELVYRDLIEQGFPPPDSFQLIAERRMGLPEKVRGRAPRETGPVLEESDWSQLGQVPIQPQAPFVGPPASFENLLKGLRQGMNTFGNFTEFCWHFPYWDDDAAQIENVVRALGAAAAKKADGVTIDSYQEDGYPAHFADCRTVIAWCLFEHYIVETLCGAAFSPAFGGLTADPFERALIFRAMELSGAGDVHSGQLSGGTVGYVESPVANLAVFSNDALVSLAASIHFNWASSYLPVPLTELERVPAVQETLEVHRLTRALEPQARALEKQVDWAVLDEEAAQLAQAGKPRI